MSSLSNLFSLKTDGDRYRGAIVYLPKPDYLE